MASLTKTQIREVAKELIGEQLNYLDFLTRSQASSAAANYDGEEDLIVNEVMRQADRIKKFLGDPNEKALHQSAREEAEARIYENWGVKNG